LRLRDHVVILQELLGFARKLQSRIKLTTDPLLNPYTPNAGASPPALFGRESQIAQFELLLARLNRGYTEKSMIVTGLRGVGKTVLLGRFRSIAEAADWAVIEWEVSKHDEAAFRRAIAREFRATLFTLSPRAKWGQRMRSAAGVLRSFTLSIDPEGTLTAGLGDAVAEGRGDSGDLIADVTDLLVSVGEAAREVDRGVVLLLDEVQFLTRPQLEALIAGIHKTVQRALPVTMVGAGLPQIAQLAGESKSYSERLFTFPTIGNLTDEQSHDALAQPARDLGVRWQPSALDVASAATGNYPYFLQELGYSVWPMADGAVVTEVDVADALPLYEARLDESFFRVRLERTTELERSYLRAMAEFGSRPCVAAEVAEKLGRSSQQVGATRATLVAKGLLYTPSHGLAAYTVPHFDKYLLRVMPVLDPPPVRPRRQRGG
jgi:hypothetical protein